MSHINRTLMKSVTFGGIALIGPVAAFFAKLAEDIWTDQEARDIERRVEALERAAGKDPAAVRVNLSELMSLATVHRAFTPDGLRHAESCLAVIRAINTRSQHAVDWDPHLSEEDLVEVLRTVPGVQSPQKELELVLHELKKVGLVRGSSGDVGPSKDFFAKTDPLFQPWNPRNDARELCRRVQASEDRIHLREVDSELGWGARRLNSAIAFMNTEGLIDDMRGMMDSPYLFHAVCLTPEAHFFLEG